MNNPFNDYILDKLLDNRRIDPITKCWLWIGYKNNFNYGILSFKGKNYFVHRLSAYMCLGLDLDSNLYALHRVNCPNKNCFSPLHVYIGDQFDNMRDRVKTGRDNNTAQTHCVWGHEFTIENTITYKNKRECKICKERRRIEKNERYRKNKMEAVGQGQTPPGVPEPSAGNPVG